MSGVKLSDISSNKRRDRRGQENLDVHITIVPPGFVFAFLGLSLIACAILFWGVYGTIPSKAFGEGILARKDQKITAIQSRGDGRVKSIRVQVGDVVKAGTLLAELDQFSVDNEISATRQAVTDLQIKLDNLRKRQADEIDHHKSNAAKTVDEFSRTIAELEKGRSKLEELLASEEKLLKKHFLSRTTELESRVTYQGIVSQIGELRIKQATTKQALADLIATSATTLDEAREEVNAQQRKLDRLVKLSKTEKTIRAPTDGRIQEIRVGVGQNVAMADVLMTIGSGEAGYEVIAFLDSKQARRVSPQMPVHIIPSSVVKEEFGSIKGNVAFVSTEPVSQAYANNILQNSGLAQKFDPSGTRFLARIKVISDSSNPSGFKWWFGEGPDFEIKAGTLSEVEIVVREQRPVSLIVPALRSVLGW